MEQSVPEALFTTGSTERGPGNAVDTGAASAERRSPRRKACPTTGLQHRRATFDEVIALRVEGVSISSISRDRRDCLEHRRPLAREGSPGVSSINHRRIASFAAEELQADEIRMFAGNKKTPSWVFVTIEVWSRLWPLTVTGRRRYRNTHALFRDLSKRMSFGRLPLIVTDGFEFYQKVIRRLLRASVSLRPGPQDAQERSYHQGRTESAAQSRVAIRRRAQ